LEAGLARELGATYVASGFVPPPLVADLLARWIGLAQRRIERDGWSQISFPPTQTNPWTWLDDYLADRAQQHAPISTHWQAGSGRRPLAVADYHGKS
jgi:hypothetical protein